MRLRFQKGDVLAFILVAALAAVVFLLFLPGSNPGSRVEVYQNGQLVKSCPLSVEDTFDLSGDYTNTITIRDGKAAITASDCPGEDCVHSGWISKTGRSLVCLPNGVEVRIVGESGDVDFVVG